MLLFFGRKKPGIKSFMSHPSWLKPWLPSWNYEGASRGEIHTPEWERHGETWLLVALLSV
jgi:hypothetical protein